MTTEAYRARGAKLVPGTVIAHRFQVRAEVGEGGMGVAYLARDMRAEKDVIIKVPQLGGTADLDPKAYDRTMRRFIRETEALRDLDHPNIPALVGHGEHGSLPYIAMTYIQGKELTSYRQLNVPRPAEIAAIGTSVATTLAACHQAGVLHRDLTPRNLMAGENGVVYVIDFGIALLLDADASRYTANFVGSEEYAPPEQHRNVKQSAQSDLYCLGGVLYFLHTARPPFVKREGRSLREQHLEDQPVPPSQLKKGLPADLEDLTLRLLAKNPEDRPRIREVLTILERHLPDDGAPEPNPVLIPDVTIPYRTPARVRPPESPVVSRVRATRPFQARRRHDFLTDAEIAATIERATAEHGLGNADAAAQTLADLRRRAIDSFGTGSRKLDEIEKALNLLSDR